MFADGVGLEPFPVAPGVGSGLRQWAGRTVEKLRAAVAGGLRFLPRLDNYTEETSEIRAGYRLMLREPVLKSSHKTKVEAVAQLDWRVIPVDKRSPRDLDVAAFVELAVERVRGGKSHMARSALRGSILDGFGVAEKVWEQHTRGRFAGKWRWKALKGKDTQNLTLSTDQFRNVTAVRPVAYGIGQSYDPDDFVIFSHDALFESALGTSDHRAAYGSFWFKDTIKKLWALHLDKYVSPVLLGSYSDYPQKVALEEALEQARSDTWLTIPQGATVAALQLATRGEAEFEAACDYQDRQMLIATSGAYLQVLEGKISDGRGDTSIHRDAAALFQWALAEGWQALINEQLVPELVEANFAGADPPQVALGSISDLELKPALDVDKGLQEMGFRHSREKLAEYYGREEATDPSDALTPAGGGDAQGSQGMRERFRRFVEWEERNRPFEPFCGGVGGKPGPCPAAGAADRIEHAVNTAGSRREMAQSLAAVGKETNAQIRSSVKAAVDGVKGEDLAGHPPAVRRDLAAVVSGHAADFANDLTSHVSHEVKYTVGQLKGGQSRGQVQEVIGSARENLGPAGVKEKFDFNAKYMKADLANVLVGHGHTPEATHAEAERIVASVAKRLGVVGQHAEEETPP
jgi:hypothetical protein